MTWNQNYIKLPLEWKYLKNDISNPIYLVQIMIHLLTLTCKVKSLAVLLYPNWSFFKELHFYCDCRLSAMKNITENKSSSSLSLLRHYSRTVQGGISFLHQAVHISLVPFITKQNSYYCVSIINVENGTNRTTPFHPVLKNSPSTAHQQENVSS